MWLHLPYMPTYEFNPIVGVKSITILYQPDVMDCQIQVKEQKLCIASYTISSSQSLQCLLQGRIKNKLDRITASNCVAMYTGLVIAYSPDIKIIKTCRLGCHAASCKVPICKARISINSFDNIII